MKFTRQLRCSNSSLFKSFNKESKGEFVTVLDRNFPKAYKPAAVEKNVYEFWEKSGYFKSQKSSDEKFSLVLPPPNVTGTLHLGHALTAAIQDTVVRWNRMQGRDVVWVPGLDHAGIATQTVVEKWLKQVKNMSRHDIGRERFLVEVTNWRQAKGGIINHQLRRFGASLDWTREIFTMDHRHSEAVVEALVRLWNAGLVYRKSALINWSCELQSAISDIEVDRVEVTGPTLITVPGYETPVTFGELIDFVYKVHGSDEELMVSTTRLETMLGDVAVAVHPNDPRFVHLHGKHLWHPFRQETIPVVCDAVVDMQFGAGAVKITPGHSHIDWDVAQRHNLPLLTVIDESGCISANVEQFQGMKRFQAREELKKELAKVGLLKITRPHAMQVPVCSRSGDIVEYLLKDQWFISCKAMAEKASLAVKEGQLQIEPNNFATTWFDWLDNIRDWCISRQLWWGHQLPLYLACKGSVSVWVAAHSLPQAAALARSRLGAEPDSVSQDPDVLDTWFSSAIYPLSALGWPHQTDDFQRYYPLDLMETGHDILFFWVARMVMLGVQLTGQLPFKKISLHGIICDHRGRKMSKSLGNVINPEDVISGISLEGLKSQLLESQKAGILSAKESQLAMEGQQKLFPEGIPECGTDALRFTLLSHNTKSHFISFDVRECEVNHHFCNKIWQACRFTLGWVGRLGVGVSVVPPTEPSLMDQWVLSRLSNAVHKVNSSFESGDFCQATEAIKQFLYYEFCDVYVETTKPILQGGSVSQVANTLETLLYCLDVSLRLASPIMPFVCEQLYKHLPGKETKSAMMAEFPSDKTLKRWKNSELDSTVELGMDVLSTIRSMKSTHGFYKKHIPVEVETCKEGAVRKMKEVIELLGNCSLQVSGRTEVEREQTITHTLRDHTLVHISLQNITKDHFEEYVNSLLKKEAKLVKSLDKLVEKTLKKNYAKRVDKDTQVKISEQIKKLQEELKILRSCLDKTRVDLPQNVTRYP